MKNISLLVLGSVFLLILMRSQHAYAYSYTIQNKPDSLLSSYYKHVSSDSIYIYLTHDYKLTEEDCYSVIRKAKKDTIGNYISSYKDIMRSGNLLGTGSYSSGLRNGKFTTYHESGTIKSNGYFIDDNPTGEWHQYDKNGVLTRRVFFSERQTIIDEVSIDNKKQIVDGRGKFKGVIFSQALGESIYTSGTIANGMMEGKWRIYRLTKSGKRTSYAVEYFDKGKMVLGKFDNEGNRFQREYHSQSLIAILEPEYYLQVEKGEHISCEQLRNNSNQQKITKPKLAYINKLQIEGLIEKRTARNNIVNKHREVEQLYKLTINSSGKVTFVESVSPEFIYPMDDLLRQIILESRWEPEYVGEVLVESTFILRMKFTPSDMARAQSVGRVPFNVTFKIE